MHITIFQSGQAGTKHAAMAKKRVMLMPEGTKKYIQRFVIYQVLKSYCFLCVLEHLLLNLISHWIPDIGLRVYPEFHLRIEFTQAISSTLARILHKKPGCRCSANYWYQYSWQVRSALL